MIHSFTLFLKETILLALRHDFATTSPRLRHDWATFLATLKSAKSMISKGIPFYNIHFYYRYYSNSFYTPSYKDFWCKENTGAQKNGLGLAAAKRRPGLGPKASTVRNLRKSICQDPQMVQPTKVIPEGDDFLFRGSGHLGPTGEVPTFFSWEGFVACKGFIIPDSRIVFSIPGF